MNFVPAIFCDKSMANFFGDESCSETSDTTFSSSEYMFYNQSWPGLNFLLKIQHWNKINNKDNTALKHFACFRVLKDGSCEWKSLWASSSNKTKHSNEKQRQPWLMSEHIPSCCNFFLLHFHTKSKWNRKKRSNIFGSRESQEAFSAGNCYIFTFSWLRFPERYSF